MMSATITIVRAAMRFDELIDSIHSAKRASDLLGPLDQGRKERYRQIVKIIHPDRYTNPTQEMLRRRATEAFARMEELLAEEARGASGSFEVSTPTRTYRCGPRAYTGSVGALYECRYERDGQLKDGLLKVPKNVRDNDLIVQEAKVLRAVFDSPDDRKNFFPRFEESFRWRDAATKQDRQVLVLRRLLGFVSLAEVREHFPLGLDARDLAWIWRRALVALSLLHEQETVHGGLYPEHLLIRPLDHGVLLTGLTTSVSFGEKVKFIGGRTMCCAPEISRKEPVGPSTDIYMLSMTMLHMLRHDSPRQFFGFINGCTFERPKARPQDALSLLGEFDELLERLYGPRKFRVFPEMNGVL